MRSFTSTSRYLIPAAAAIALLLAVACGGSDDGGGILGRSTPTAQVPTPSPVLGEREARAAANRVYSDFVAMLSDARPPAAFIADFTASCRQSVTLSALQAGVDAFRKDKPGVVAKKMDLVDFGDKVTVETRDDGFNLRLPGTRDATVQVNGRATNAHEYFAQQGLEKDSEGASGSNLRLVKEGDKLLVSDCGQLKGVAEYKPSSTPARSTPTVAPKR